MTLKDGLDQHIPHLHSQAERLVAALDADPALAAPFLQALRALEDHLGAAAGDSPTNVRPLADPAWQDGTAHPEQHAEAESAQFQQALRQVPTGVCIMHGPEHRYTFTNPIYEQVVGRTDMVGKTVPELFPEIAGQGIYELLDQVYATGEPFTTSEILIKFDRGGSAGVEDVYFDLNYLPLRAEDGAISAVVAYVLDISDRRALDHERTRVLQLTQEAHAAADAERQRLLAVLHQAPTAICLLDGPEHIFTFANVRYSQLVGGRDLVGQTVRAALPEITGQGFFELLDRVYATGVPFIGNEVLIQLDRASTGTLEDTFLNFIYAPLRDATDAISGIFVQAVDVTELVAARRNADAAVVLRDQFLTIAAHELKTPLTSLLGYIQVLQRRMQRAADSDERTARTLAMIGAQGQRLNRLIDTLLDVARINMGHLSLDRAPVDLGLLTTRVIEEISVTVDQRLIELTVPPQPCRVLGDSLRLEQVIVNLLQNALKYSPAGGAIQVDVGCDQMQAWVRVRDSGMGIPAAALPHLFERFYRVQEGDAGLISGMGIGLSVVHEIVTLHGGTVTVESVEGSGSTFAIWLPLGADGESVGGG